ncbi:MAG: T9SS type A sorting domain-containing protein [Sphingobacteriales bacterium]|nr:MAG: T9SS type A sorting domain-containing protein [Sphingobacteriales bacterium]
MKYNLLSFAFFLCCLCSTNLLKAQCSVTSTPYSYPYITGACVNGFTFASVASNNPGNSSNGYNSFTTPVRNLTIGNTYPYTVTYPYSYYAIGLNIWIDLNNNNNYESSEMVVGASLSYTSSRSGNITIPSTATAGTNVHMRIRCMYYTNLSGSAACTSYPSPYGYGETEDYLVNLINPCFPPTITAQPQNTTTCEASNTSLSMTTSGTGNLYQWEMSTGGGSFSQLANSATYSGVTSNMLSLSNTPANINGAKIRCKTTSNCGVARYSDTVALNVTPLAKVGHQVLGDTICTTVDKTITFTPTGDVNNYQWQMGTLSNGFTNLQNSAPFDGVNTQYLQINRTPDSVNGQSFRCVFNGVCNSATTEPIGLYVIFPPFFSKEPANDTVYENTAATFAVEVQNNTSFIYQWQASSNGGQTFSNISNDALYANYGTPTLTVKNSIAKNDWMFRCVIRSDDRLCGKFFDTSAAGKIIIKYPTTVASLDGKQFVTVTPNPIVDNVLRMISNEELKNKTVKTTITDMLGRTVITTDMKFNSNTGNISVANLAPGIYYVKLQKDGAMLDGSYTFVKQ